MTKYEITNDSFEGKIAVYFLDGNLVQLSFIDTAIADELKNSYKKFIPIAETDLKEFSTKAKCTIAKVDIIVTFTQWYNLYNLKRNKEDAERVWNKIPQTDRVTCLYNTKKYLKYCGRNIGWYNQMYPDTFLRKSHFLTDWDKI